MGSLLVLLSHCFFPLAFFLERLAMRFMVRFKAVTQVINVERRVTEKYRQDGCDFQ